MVTAMTVNTHTHTHTHTHTFIISLMKIVTHTYEVLSAQEELKLKAE